MTKAGIEAIIRALNNAGVRYLAVGGIAVNAYGHRRFTADIDLALAMASENLEKAVRALESLNYRPLVPVRLHDLVDESKRREWIETKHAVVLNLIGPRADDPRVDIMLQPPFHFDEEWERSEVDQSTGQDTCVRIVSLPTLIAMKTGTGRAKDLDDLEQLRRIQCMRETYE